MIDIYHNETKFCSMHWTHFLLGS